MKQRSEYISALERKSADLEVYLVWEAGGSAGGKGRMSLRYWLDIGSINSKSDY